MSFSQQISHDKSFNLAPKSKNCQFATFQCYAERSRNVPQLSWAHSILLTNLQLLIAFGAVGQSGPAVPSPAD